jgi:hypothetical protein
MSPEGMGMGVGLALLRFLLASGIGRDIARVVLTIRWQSPRRRRCGINVKPK